MNKLMDAKFFGGPRDGEWITIAPISCVIVPVVDYKRGLHAQEYWRYGDRLVWRDPDRQCP